MQGRQEYQPKLFSVIDMEARIPKRHLLRRIDKILDLSFVREMTAHLYCHDNGRPSVDPELFFRICLITHLYNIPSDRQVCEELDYNLAYRWFCRLALEDGVPDHSSLTKIRDRLGEETFKNIFERIVRLCIEKDLVKGDKVMMDGSLIRADAALKSLVPRNEDGTPSEIEPPKYIIGQKYSNDTHISYTDPDATLAAKPNDHKQLMHKVHNTVDRASRVIVDSHVTTGSDVEGKVMMGRLDHIEQTFNFNVSELTADRGYGYGENLQALHERGIHSFVPRFHSDAGERVERDSKGFTFDKTQDCYICPKGHLMFPIQGSTEQYKRYRMTGGHCSKCPLKTTCFTTGSMRTRNTKHIEVHIYQDAIDRAARMEATDEFRQIRGERQWKIEGLFGEAKVHHGLRRARYRGRAKMQIQAYMVATVQNLKRLMEAMADLSAKIFQTFGIQKISLKLSIKFQRGNSTLRFA
jgi:transposase